MPAIVATLLALHAGSGVRLPQDGSAWAWVVARCGALSHALYLVHWPVFVVWRSIAGLPFAPLAAVGALALSVALAWALHRLVEVPFRRPGPERAWRAVSAAVVLLLGVALVGGKVFLGRGVPERIPPEIQALGSYDEGVLSQARRCRFCFRAGEDPAGIGACLRGYRGQAAGDPAWAIWGDSHATSLVAGMMLNPGSSSFLGFGASGCPPLARMATQGHRQCHLVGARVLEVLEQTPSVRTAVLHARWSSYARHNNRNNVLDAQGGPVRASFLEEVDQAIGTLRERGYRVVLVGPVPEPGRPAPQTVMRRAWYEGQIPEIGIPRDAYDRRRAAALQWLARREDRGGLGGAAWADLSWSGALPGH